MRYKKDWDKTAERFDAWWEGEMIDRVMLQVTAPRKGKKQNSTWGEWTLAHNTDNPEIAFNEYDRYCSETFFGGEDYPDLWVNMGPGVMAAYLGNEPEIREDTVWFESPEDWDAVFKKTKYNPGSYWWKKVKSFTKIAVKTAGDKYFVGMTDLGGNLDILSSLRGAQNTVFDLVDNPEKVKNILKTINELWFKYYDELNAIMRTHSQCSNAWMHLWCRQNWYPLQCDFSAMISPVMFEEFVAPYLEEQCRFLDKAIYHWDGPGQIPHLDILLDIPGLHGIQWTPGDGDERMESPKWYPLYKRIQEKGKLLVLLDIKKENIEELMNNVSHKGLLIRTKCDSQEEAEELLKNAAKWTRG